MRPVKAFYYFPPDLLQSGDDAAGGGVYRASGLEGVLSTIGDTVAKIVKATQKGGGSIPAYNPNQTAQSTAANPLLWLLLAGAGIGVIVLAWRGGK
jgi:hypothetical protein